MTLEELEIIVTAKVEDALKELEKFVPAIRGKVKQAEEAFQKMDTKKVTKKLQQAVNFMKKKMQDFKKSSENNEIAIKVNNKDAKKQITQLEKEIDSLQKKINARKLRLDFVKQSANQMYNNNRSDGGVKDNLGENSKYIKLCEQEKELNNEIQVYNKLLENAKSKMIQLKQETSQVAIAQNKLSNFKINDKDAEKQIAQIQKQIDDLQKKISTKQLKLDFVRQSANQMYNNNRSDGSVKENLGENTKYIKLSKQEKELNCEIQIYKKMLESAKSKMAELKQQTSQTATTQNKLSSFFSAFKQKIEQVKPSIIGIKNGFKGMPQITQSITNSVKNMEKSVKVGLGHILKYAGALFSMQGIYSTLRSCAHSWLASQNSEAKQLNANIEYMKYAMGSALAPVIQFVTNCVYQLLKAVQSVVYALFKVNIFAKASASAFKNAQKQAKNTSKQLASVHNEINNIADHDSGNPSPNIGDLSKMETLPNNIIELIKNGNWYQVGEEVGKKINESLEKIPWDNIQNNAKKVATNIADFINGFIKETNWELVGSTIGNGINTGLKFVDTFFKKTEFEKIGKSVAKTVNSAVKTQDWKLTGQTIADGINSAVDTANGFVTDFDWGETGTAIGTALENAINNIDWDKIADTLWKRNKRCF